MLANIILDLQNQFNTCTNPQEYAFLNGILCGISGRYTDVVIDLEPVRFRRGFDIGYLLHLLVTMQQYRLEQTIAECQPASHDDGVERDFKEGILLGLKGEPAFRQDGTAIQTPRMRGYDMGRLIAAMSLSAIAM